MREPDDPEFPEWYYEQMEELFGPEKAAWARLPRAERMKELALIHKNFFAPDDLMAWPPELGGDAPYE